MELSAKCFVVYLQAFFLVLSVPCGLLLAFPEVAFPYGSAFGISISSVLPHGDSHSIYFATAMTGDPSPMTTNFFARYTGMLMVITCVGPQLGVPQRAFLKQMLVLNVGSFFM